MICTDLLSILVPCVDQGAEPTGECVARHRQHFSHGRSAQCLGFVALGIINIVPCTTFHDEKRRTKTLQLADVGG